MHTILVVDDEAVCREMVSTALEKHGFAAVRAADGAAALKLLETHPIALVLLDALMPGIDGEAVLRAVRADARFRRLPVIMLTSVGSKDFVRRVFDVGVHGYLLKANLSLNELIVRVNRCLACELPRPSLLAAGAGK